jgi:hypothetical protein
MSLVIVGVFVAPIEVASLILNFVAQVLHFWKHQPRSVNLWPILCFVMNMGDIIALVTVIGYFNHFKRVISSYILLCLLHLNVGLDRCLSCDLVL